MQFRNAKCYELYIYVDGFAANKTTQDICKSQNKNETNITNSNSYSFHSTHDVHKFIGEKTLF